MTEQPDMPKLDATASIRFPAALADAAKRAAARDGFASASEWIRAMVVQEIRRRDTAVPVAAVLDGPTIDAEPSGEAGAGDDTGRDLTGGPERSRERAGGKDGSEGERVPRLCPTCLHDGVLDRVLDRAEAAEAEAAELRRTIRAINDAKELDRSEEETGNGR